MERLILASGEDQNTKRGPLGRAIDLARAVRSAHTASRVMTGLPGFREALRQHQEDEVPPRDTAELMDRAARKGHLGADLEARLIAGEPVTDAQRALSDMRDTAEIELLGSDPSGPEKIDADVLAQLVGQGQAEPPRKPTS